MRVSGVSARIKVLALAAVLVTAFTAYQVFAATTVGTNFSTDGNSTIGGTLAVTGATNLAEFGTLPATAGNVLVGDGTDFESLALSGDITSVSGTGVVVVNNAGTADALTTNQGTTATVLHGNAAGTPSFGGVVTGDVTDETLSASDLAPTLTLADADLLDLGAILHDDATAQGDRLPNCGATPTDITGTNEGYLCWNQTGNSLLVNDGAAWVAAGAAGDVTDVLAGSGIAVTNSGGPQPSVAFNYSDNRGTNPALSAGQCVFSATEGGATSSAVLCEGDTANDFEVALIFPNPSSDMNYSFPALSGQLIGSNGTSTVTSTMIEDQTDCYNLPLGSWMNMNTSAVIAFGTPTDAAPNYSLINTALALVYDDDTDGGGADVVDSDFIGTTMFLPTNFTGSNVFLRWKVSKDAHAGVADHIKCEYSVNGGAVGTAATTEISAAAATTYNVTPTGTFAASDAMGIRCRAADASGGATYDDTIRIHAVAMCGTATQ